MKQRKLPAEFAGVVEQYGEEIVACVLDAGLCSEAVEKLVGVGRATQRWEVLAAVTVLARAYNSMSSAYCKEKGWSEELLAQCDRDLQLAFAGKLVVPGRLVLDS